MASKYEGLLDLLEQKRAELGELEKQIAAETPLAIKTANAHRKRNVLALLSCGAAAPAILVATLLVALGPPRDTSSLGFVYGTSAVYAGFAVILAYYAKSFHNKARSYIAQA